MKLLFVVWAVVLALSVEARHYQLKQCLTARKECPYTLQWDPVCSTQGCTYSNIGHMKCAGGRFWYAGECRDSY